MDTDLGTDANNPCFTILEQQGNPTAAIVDGTGRIYLANSSCVRRFSADGELDTSFNNNSGVLYAGGMSVQSLKFDSTGRLLAGGYKWSGGGNGQTYYDFAVARYSADGILDGAYGSGGVASFDLNTTATVAGYQYLYDMTVDAYGRVIATGFSQ